MVSYFVGMLVDSAISIAEGFVSNYLSEQYVYQTTNVKEKLKQMERSLTKIKAVVTDAENVDINENEHLERWLYELKKAIYDAEYVMDVFDYERLKNEAEGWPQTETDKGRLIKRARHYQASTSKFIKRLFFSDEQLSDIELVVNKFNDLEKEMDMFAKLLEPHRKQAANAADKVSELRETTSELVETKLYGRDREEKQLLELLLRSSNGSETTCFSVLSIVGVGGVGKTTLAQFIFNHPSLEREFDIKAWVCVSNNLSIKTLMKDILETSRISKPTDLYSLNTLNEIQRILREGLQSKKFLIVLDDVWEDMKQDNSEKICLPFHNGNNGSKILVTSRSRDVARGMGASDDMQVDLSPLRFGYYWEFFQKCAFRNENPENYPQLKDIGEKIARKLGCLPLAAKMVGGVLSKKLNVDHWRGILTSMAWKEQDCGIMPALKLSYNHLPGHLKKCFLYCCLFPKDHRYEATTLVDIWIALDCVKPIDKNKRLADIQREYVDELVNRCFLDEKLLYSCYYMIHDLLHDLAESILGHEIYRVKDDESLPKEMSHNVRHLYLESRSNNTNLELVMQNLNIAPKQLRSLVYVSYGVRKVKEELEMSNKTRYKLRGLRFLYVDVYTSNALAAFENVCNMRHLRCINYKVGDSPNFESLVIPASFWKLHQLETLRWRMGYRGMGPIVENWDHTNKLINLRYVDKFFSYNPINCSHLGRLKSLEVMPGGTIRIDENLQNDIGQLGKLDKIGGGLSLEVHTKLSGKEAEKAKLNQKLYLTKLCIYDYCCQENEGIEAVAIEALQPHKNLEDLIISGCSNITMAPHWLSTLSNLKTLDLNDLPNLQELPPDLGYHLLVLKKLCLRNLPLKQIDVGDATAVNDHRVMVFFPSLTYISISDMKNFEGWSIYKRIHNQPTIYLPKLCNIHISECPKIGSLSNCIGIPFLLSSTQNCYFIKLIVPFTFERLEEEENEEEGEILEMEIDVESLINIPDCHDPKFVSRIKYLHVTMLDTVDLLSALWEKLSSVETLSIQWVEELQSLDVFNITSHATMIKKLFIRRCNNLKFLSAKCFFVQALSSLETLIIVECDKLESLTSHQPWNASSIKTLIIKKCKKLSFLSADISFSSLEKLIIEDCDELESLTVYNPDHQLWNASSIHTLIIKNCNKLTFLSANFSFSSLVLLDIEHCDQLESLTGGNVDNHGQNDLLLPVSMEMVSIVKCNKLKLSPTTVQRLLYADFVNIENFKELEDLLHLAEQMYEEEESRMELE